MTVSFKGAGLRLSINGLDYAAAMVGVEAAALKAVIDVETAGMGFDKSGRLRMLFEPVQFYKRLSGKELASAVSLGIAKPVRSGWTYPADSYPSLLAAIPINETAALESASWGLPQLMGFNHGLAGFPTAAAMIEAFCASEDAQVLGMARFLKATGLSTKLRDRDWPAFARGYNGPAYRTNNYDTKLQMAFARASATPSKAQAFPHPTTGAAPHPPYVTHDLRGDEQVTPSDVPHVLPKTGQGAPPTLWQRIAALFTHKA